MNINIAKADTQIEVPAWETLSADSQEYLKDYAWKQVLNDTVAGLAIINGKVCMNKVPLDNTPVDQFGAIVMSKVQKKIDAIVSGTVRVAGVRVGDPIRADAIELAIDKTVRGQFKKAGKALDAKAMRAEAIELIGRNPAYMHLAQKRADEAKTFFADGEALAALEAKTE